MGLGDIAFPDPSLAATVAALPWFTDGINKDEVDALLGLSEISSQDLDLAETVAASPWFTDGITHDEANALAGLNSIAFHDLDVAKTVAALPWFTDGTNHVEEKALAGLSGVASQDAGLAISVAGLPWFVDGITNEEANAIWELEILASEDARLAVSVVGLPWIVDGINRHEYRALAGLDDIASQDLELARTAATLPWFDGGQNRSLNIYVLGSLGHIASRDSVAFGEMTRQPWFADGLDEEEAALVVIFASESPELYPHLLRTHYSQTRTVSLNLAGKVNIWIFQNTPFAAEEDLLTVIENTARIGEGLLRVPFPETDVILLIADRSDTRNVIRAGHFGTHMRIVRTDKVYHLSHETVHYWFFAPPQWLTEGAAEFIARYVDNRTGLKILDDSRAENARSFANCVDSYRIENIRHLTVVLVNNWEITRPLRCPYYMGEYFLHSASRIAGEEATMSALGELHLSELGKEHDAVEDRIYEIFLKHVPKNRQEGFRTFYQEVHGAAAAFGNTDYPDDHGDEAEFATPIAAGESTGGTLNYMFDFDYFRFSAQEGRKYRFTVNHDMLRTTSVGLYAPDGKTGMNKSWISRELVPTGPRIVWIAPSSDDYYVAVHNYGGKKGGYTLTIDEADDAADDHGDTPEAATTIAFGEVVQGELEMDADIDYFSFPVAEGQVFRVGIEMDTLQDFRFRITMPAGSFYRRDDAGEFYSNGPLGFPGRAGSSGVTHFAVDAPYGTTGTYSIKVVQIDD